mmetsp:Transcript_27101/g.46068  ORF Transcript_27101/g.46068 Transcript_27101/m.46068 type:complete len:518 (+) Transcript_27101:67-1620(+)
MIWWHSYILRGLEILLALLLLQICVIYIKWRLSPLQNLPGPRGKFFLIGDFLDIYFGPFFSVHQKWWKESNYAPLMSYTSLFGRWVVLPCDPDLVKHILTAPSAQEPVRYYKQFDFFKDMLGDGLISLEGKNWSRHRRILQPCFQTGLVKDALKEALPSKVDSIIESWKKSEGRVIDVYAHMSAITLDILGVVSFAHEFNALDTITEWANDSGADKIDEIQDPMMKSLSQVFKPKLVWIIMSMLKMGWLRRFDSKRNITKQLMDEAAEDIIKAAEENKSEMKKQSLIHIMLNAMSKDESQERNALSMQELKDELKLFIVAGHETTSTLCYWAFYALAKYPDVQEKVLQDIEKHAVSDEQIDLEAVEKMEYFLAFINECLRLTSPAGMLFRYNSRTENWNGAIIPAHTRIVIPIFLLHRHPKYWTDPYKFMPERWLNIDNGSGETKKRHPFTFLPFSGGGRNCIGERFARIEAQLILVNLIRRFQIKLAPSMQNTELEYRSSLTMKSKPRVQIVVKSR